MKVTLEFSDPEERSEYMLALKAVDWHLTVTEFDTWLRNEVKYSELTPETADAYETVRSKLWEIRHEHGTDDE